MPTDYLHLPPLDVNTREFISAFDELPWWGARFGRLLFDHIPIRPNIRILDVGCGAGFPLFELANVFGASCRVIGVDIWQAALARVAAKRAVYRLTNADAAAADAAQMPFPDDTFDLIVSNLGLNNFASAIGVLAECFRVATPGGRVILTTNLSGHYREFYAVFRETLIELCHDELVARLDAQEAHRGTTESICALLKQAGFQVVKVVVEPFQSRFQDGSAFFQHWLTRLGFLDGWRDVIGPADEEQVFAQVERELNALAARQGALRMTVPMLYVEAEKPPASDWRHDR